MINNFAERLTKKLLSSGTITEDDSELYTYGLFILISQMMFFIITAIFGLLLGCLLESIIFYVSFQFIRKYAGGYHASSEGRCELMSTLSILASIVVIRLSKQFDFQMVLLIAAAICAVCIFCFCPLDTPEKPLSDKEFKHFRKISLIILLVIITVIVISYCFELTALLVPCCMSLILESILLTAGKLKKTVTKEEYYE
ncbi:MAG: accessory gene regulator B family protein [Eubacterium sp.]|nr:accessory gene regulator B family protein [Eubacterium sp.]